MMQKALVKNAKWPNCRENLTWEGSRRKMPPPQVSDGPTEDRYANSLEGVWGATPTVCCVNERILLPSGRYNPRHDQNQYQIELPQQLSKCIHSSNFSRVMYST